MEANFVTEGHYPVPLLLFSEPFPIFLLSTNDFMGLYYKKYVETNNFCRAFGPWQRIWSMDTR